MLEKGLVQLYTGNGKGKTTAAFGQALRAAGAGNKVIIYQFLKPPTLDLAERKALAKCNLPITIHPLELPWDMAKSFKDAQLMNLTSEKIHEICQQAAEAAAKRLWDVFIFDELAYCHAKGLAKLEDIKHVIDSRDERVEIILTGQDAKPELMELADYVVEMKSRKHPFEKGIYARKGIEY
jgi:cob(I)alamin adenosyltransferase